MTNVPIPDPIVLTQLGEHFAAGLCELPDAAPTVRYARACRRWFENRLVDGYAGGYLYPSGRMVPEEQAVLTFDFSFTMRWNEMSLQRKLAGATPLQQEALHGLCTLFELEENWRETP